MKLKRLSRFSAFGIGLFLAAALVLPAPANLPGGGTNGPNVTLADNGASVTVANGIVSILCSKSSASLSQINYTFNNGGGVRTLNLLSGGHNGGQFYWENSGSQSGTFSYSIVVDPALNGGSYAEIQLVSTSVSNLVLEVHYSLLRGASGFYVTAIWRHRASDGAASMGESRDNIYAGSIFNWMSVDSARNRLMEVSGGSAIPVFDAPREVSLWTNGIYAGQYEDKYSYSADLGSQRVWGWSSVGAGGKNVGLWNISASSEYYNGGPLKRELMEHLGTTVLNMLNGSHYGGGTDAAWAAGEVWTKVYGPYFIYCNSISNAITDPAQASAALYADARAQAAAEAGAWPYAWFSNPDYAPASNRGTVSGKFVIADSGNPNASASNLWVGLVQQPSTQNGVYDFQKWMKPCQFWARSDSNGTFTVSNVIAGTNYTLYAFGPGAAGTFQSQILNGGNPRNTFDLPAAPFSVSVVGGSTSRLDTVTWTPERVGPTVFEIGYPDRTGGKFRHGDDYWVGDEGPGPAAPSPIWSKHLEYPFDFPNGPDYVVGQSRWTTDWNYVQPVVADSQGNFNGSTSTITFNLGAAPAAGSEASLYLALCSDFQGPLIIQVNGSNITGSNGYFPNYSGSSDGSDTTIRQGIHGCFSDARFNFSGSLLRQGQNTLTINMRKGGYFANHAMYDYLRLELAGYIPPAPANVTAYAGNRCNLVRWAVSPGATSYNILRSIQSGAGYLPVATNVMGPVCGSGLNDAEYLDTNVTDGTTYYYVVQSVNPTGASGNSPQSAGAMPSTAIAAGAPQPPTGLIASGGHHFVRLDWNPSPGANYYTIQRSTLVPDGAGNFVTLSTITLDNAVVGATYTDTSPTDGTLYQYSVKAAGAGGASPGCPPVRVAPRPAPPGMAPGGLAANPLQATNIVLTWSAVPGAIGYVVERAAGAGGNYVLLNSITETTYTDYGVPTNTTYYYRVTAMNAGGASSGALTTTRPPAPASLTAVAGNNRVMLNWPASVGATSYMIQRGGASGAETNVTTTVATNYTDSTALNGATYYYEIAAVGSAGTSGNSPEASATPHVPHPIIASVSIWGGRLVLSGAGGVGGSDYYLLASTNLMLPLDRWPRVATNQFDPGGNFNCTNLLNPDLPGCYYILQVP